MKFLAGVLAGIVLGGAVGAATLAGAQGRQWEDAVRDQQLQQMQWDLQRILQQQQIQQGQQWLDHLQTLRHPC